LFDLKQVTIGDKFAGSFFNGLAACCKKCRCVVGITIDPSHTISAIKAEFPGRNIAGTPETKFNLIRLEKSCDAGAVTIDRFV
jgi:hypothetical protein